MKSAVLLHGTGGSDKDYFWFAKTKERLERNGYRVWWPLLPNTDKPNLKQSLAFLEEHYDLMHWNDEMIIIGHSSSCPLILSWLEKFNIKVKQVILVSGFYQSIDNEGYSDLMLPKSFDWENIRTKANEFVLINSNNDPWGCDDQQARQPAIELGATLVVATNQGHMGSISCDQPYKEFPILNKLLEQS